VEDRNKTRCPHCSETLQKWSSPELGAWSSDYQYVCFNDHCPYFEGGWRWMLEQYNVTASYRYRFEPVTGERGPLPVWSKQALRAYIIESEVGGPSHDSSRVGGARDSAGCVPSGS
jgi:hypothetical protein